jgi:hypothetical protein
VKKVSLILDKPNLFPKLNVDEIPESLWGTQDITGTIADEDNHEIELNVNVSFDNITWYQTNITGGIWKIRFNFSYFEEKEYTLYLKATDLEAEVSMDLPITVLGPFKKPIFLEILPISPVNVNVDDNLTFTVFYRGRDHRGTTVQWLVDSIEVFGSDENNITELDINFSEIGNHEVTIIVSNAEDSELFSIHSWLVNVKAVLILEPLSETLINSIVGEAIILQYGIVKGEVKDITWTINGQLVEGNDYLYFVPETAGTHTVKVTITDDYGNIGFIEYTIETSTPPGSEKANKTEEKGQDDNKEIKRTGRFIIAGVGIFLIIVIIISILLIIMAIKKSGKRKVGAQSRVPMPKTPGVISPPPQQVQVTNRQLPETSSQQQVVQKPLLSDTYPPIQTINFQSQVQQPPQSSQPPQQAPAPVQPLQKTVPTYQPPIYQPAQQFQQYQQPPQPQQSQHQIPVQQYSSQPRQLQQQINPPAQQPIPHPSLTFTPTLTCPICNQPTQYYPDQNGNWCSYCQRFV